MISLEKIENISMISLVIAILSVPLYLLINFQGKKLNVSDLTPKYVGSDKCVECHRQEYREWQKSHHAKSMNRADSSTVVGDFDNKTVVYNNITHKLYKRGNKFYAYTDGEDGKLQEFEIKYVFGFYPLQQYLVELKGGRLQTLALTWDAKNKKWYHIAAVHYPNEVIEHDNWLHWTNQAQNWNSMCADCHSTNVAKGYDIATDSYRTTFSEINVACEACHGAASRHVEWANNQQYNESITNYGLTVKTSDINNEEYVDLCMRCHSRRTAISDFHHDLDIYNHSIPTLPTPVNYHIDGQIKDEDYVFASFAQSKMYMRDVKCNDCHNVHSNKLLYDDNRLCTQCHRADDYDTYSHHFHKQKGEKGEAVVAADGVRFEVGDGSRCVNCHAPARFYMGVDYRNDHSFRVPRPDLTEKLGTPNACNNCHADKSPQWAVNYINKWHGISRHSQYGEVFKSAESGDNKSFMKLVDIYEDEVYPPIIRATALTFMGQYYQKQSKEILISAMQNTNNHVRYNALKNIVVDDAKSFKAVLELLSDNTKAIRIECSNKLQGINRGEMQSKYLKLLQKADNENVEQLRYNADFPSGKFNLANYYYNTHQIDKAETWFLKTLEQDREFHAAKLNLAYLYNSVGNHAKADLMFTDYLQNMQNDGNSMFAYSLFLAERKFYDKSLKYMLTASELLPENARILYNIAMMYEFEKNRKKAIQYLQKAIAIDANNAEYRSALERLRVKLKIKS